MKRPDAAFGRAFDDPALGYLHPVDLDSRPAPARRALCEVLTGLGVTVHELVGEGLTGDAVYTFDPMLVADAGAIPLRSGKPDRQGEELADRGLGERPWVSPRSAGSRRLGPSTAGTRCG